MKQSYLYWVLLLLSLGIIAILGVTYSGPVIYSLETDLFPSSFHENTDALKMKSFNSTVDILPLVQDLLDYSGPIVLNINTRDMNQVKYYLDLFSKNNIKLKNLMVNLDMTESEMAEFSSNNLLQQKLLQELMDSTIAIDELDSLMVTYRDDNDMLISLKLQREAILKRIHELNGEYQQTSEKIQKIAEKTGLDTTSEKETVQDINRIVNTMDEKSPLIKTPPPHIPTLSLLVKPETGKYGDSIGFSGIFSSGITAQDRATITINIDSREVARANTNQDGIYSSLFEIEQITPGEHAVVATSGMVSSGTRTFSVTPVNSTTSLYILAVYNKPEIQAMGEIRAGKQVRNAPVAIISDYRTILRQTTDKNGVYRTQLSLSPGTHHIQVRFVNETYPIFMSKSPAYEVIAGPDSILSIHLLDADMGADELSLTLDPATARYKDVINITGRLGGKYTQNKTVDLFVDNIFARSLETRSDGSYMGTYAVEKIRAGNHTFFTHYREPEAGEIYSETRQIVMKESDTITALDCGTTDGGTGVICMGNVTARGMGVSSAPVELVWDDQNIITVQTNATGAFRQKISLPGGNHNIFAQFTSPDYPLLPSRSGLQTVAVLPQAPGLSLTISPATGIYKDGLTFEGVLTQPDTLQNDVEIFIDNDYVNTEKTDSKRRYSSHLILEQLPAGKHSVLVRAGNIASENKTFQVIPVFSRISLDIIKPNNSALYECSGTVLAFDHYGEIIRSPSTIGDAEAILAGFGKNPLSRANRPVGFARVEIISNNDTMLQTITDENGHFSELIILPAGDNRVVARFINDSFPIFPSSSREMHVNNPSTNISLASGAERSPLRILEPLVVGAVLLVFIGGAAFYLKRRSGFFSQKSASAGSRISSDIPRKAGSASPGETQQSRDSAGYVQPAQDPIFIRYVRVLEIEGLSTAARTVYVHFTGTIAQKSPVRNHRVLTPREFLQSCNGQTFMTPFTSFISVYERIRYGGIKTPETKAEFEKSVQKTDESLEGEDH